MARGEGPLREAKTQRDAWLETGFAMLAEGGAENVRIEPLARRLSVTKGGFYWHFKDRADLLAAMLERWRDGRVTVIARHVTPDGDETAEGVLRRLLSRYLDQPNPRGMAIEMAVRDWARHDARVAEAVATVDAARLAHVAPLFEALGLPPDEAAARARLFYAYVFGQNLLAPTVDPAEAAGQQDRIAAILIGAGGG
ncbi:TetR/AcrR family transcriptional regulator [Roseospira navarrensis]|uniref:TetR family transcriptional regulator n=1 Tax=Roseospira navarrensis TaxID=140058 RepID=A0A7X1ZBN4_9PROT|nr:TetR/AcrR family transcriptional regulator [Roseospira navarrensis]MQX35388.1 TetR family transcriptional regulator [Roseospira navarrensis]